MRLTGPCVDITSASTWAATAAGMAEFRPLLAAIRKQLAEALHRDTLLTARVLELEDQLAAAQRELEGLRKRPSVQTLQRATLDPAVNLLFVQLRRRLQEREKTIEKLRDDLDAVGTAGDSNVMVTRLKARCKQLLQENEELGNQLSESRAEAAERSLAAERRVSAALRKLLDDKDAMKLTAQLMEELEELQSENAVLRTNATQAQTDLKAARAAAAQAQQQLASIQQYAADLEARLAAATESGPDAKRPRLESHGTQ